MNRPFRRMALLALLVAGGFALAAGWRPGAVSEPPAPLSKSIGRLLGDLGTLSAAGDLIVFQSPLVKTTDKDGVLFAFRDGKPMHYGRAGFDLIGPTAVDRKIVITAVRKRAHPGEDRPVSEDEYTVETCDIDARLCTELISQNEFRAAVGKRRVVSIKFFRRQSDLIAVIGSSLGSQGGPLGGYTIFRKIDGGKLELVKHIDGQSFGPYDVSIYEGSIIFNGMTIQDKFEKKNTACNRNDHCIFAYDIENHKYKTITELTGFENIKLDSKDEKYPENGNLYSGYLFNKKIIHS